MLRLFLATRQGAPRRGAPGHRILGAGASWSSSPVYAQLAAADDHAHVLIQQAKAPPKGDRRTRAGAAREGFSCAPLVYTQADVRAVDDLHEPDVDAFGKARMTLDQGSPSLHGGGIDRCDPQYGVGIAHRHRSDLDRLPTEGQR